VKRVRVVVSGRVQGVFYRATCAARARELGLAGFVRNLPDGRLEAAFEGPESDVDAMVSWCRRGPQHARVDAVELVVESPKGDHPFLVTG
jgi:acylphosphatase